MKKLSHLIGRGVKYLTDEDLSVFKLILGKALRLNGQMKSI